MPRSPLIVFCALLFAALALVPAAAAKPTTQVCTAKAPQVVGDEVTGKLSSSNVDPLQGRYATCAHAKKVMKAATKLEVEKPRPIRSLYCRPSVDPYYMNVVSYACTFRGADTPMFVRLTFKVTYKE